MNIISFGRHCLVPCGTEATATCPLFAPASRKQHKNVHKPGEDPVSSRPVVSAVETPGTTGHPGFSQGGGLGNQSRPQHGRDGKSTCQKQQICHSRLGPSTSVKKGCYDCNMGVEGHCVRQMEPGKHPPGWTSHSFMDGE